MTIEKHKERLKNDPYIVGLRNNPMYKFRCGNCGGTGFIDCGNSESGDVGYGWECTQCFGSGQVTEEWDGRLYIG